MDSIPNFPRPRQWGILEFLDMVLRGNIEGWRATSVRMGRNGFQSRGRPSQRGSSPPSALPRPTVTDGENKGQGPFALGSGKLSSCYIYVDGVATYVAEVSLHM